MEKQARRKFFLSTLAVLGGSTLTAWIFRRNILMNTIFKSSLNPDISATYAPDLDTDICVLTSKQTEGPFYIPSPERSNIIEDRIGKGLDLKLQILRYPDCTPIENAVVEVWQGDAEGNYSGYPDQVAMDAWKLFMFVAINGEKKPDGEFTTTPTEKSTFLRGLQKTDKDGWVTFNTIFPAWYLQRIPHIHFKVIIGEEEQLTSQLYFDKEIQDKVFTTLEPYKKQGICPTTVQNDLAVTGTGKLEGVLLKPLWSDDSPLTATAKIGIKPA